MVGSDLDYEGRVSFANTKVFDNDTTINGVHFDAIISSRFIKKFVLYRHKDISGISGTGVVAIGVEFDGKKCAVYWNSEKTDIRSIVIYDSLDDVKAVHGHDGATEIVIINN